eukprot:GHUV01002546.1.p1 GENE.GHUV01002546.1~~GHUV01002546.1.p1  ORF type:complete len:235 (+),score=18.02 GHUV01002546.1:79-783(+)
MSRSAAVLPSCGLHIGVERRCETAQCWHKQASLHRAILVVFLLTLNAVVPRVPRRSPYSRQGAPQHQYYVPGMLACLCTSQTTAFRAGASKNAIRIHIKMEHGMLAQPTAGWNVRGQPHSALQTDTQYATQTAVPKQQQVFKQEVVTDMSGSDSDSDSSGPVRVPLKLVVQDAVKRWFNETLSEARRGDVKQQALLSQMYAEGYGCKQDMEQSRVWSERARLRGYQMVGVYDAI